MVNESNFCSMKAGVEYMTLMEDNTIMYLSVWTPKNHLCFKWKIKGF